MNKNNIIHKLGNFLSGQAPTYTDIHEMLRHLDGARISILVVDASGSMDCKDWHQTPPANAKRWDYNNCPYRNYKPDSKLQQWYRTHL